MEKQIRDSAVLLWNRRYPKAPITEADVHVPAVQPGRLRGSITREGRHVGYFFLSASAEGGHHTFAGPYAEPDFIIAYGAQD